MLKDLVGSLESKVAEVTAKLQSRDTEIAAYRRISHKARSRQDVTKSKQVKETIQEEVPPALIVKEIDPESDDDYDDKQDRLRASKQASKRNKANRRKKRRNRRKVSSGGSGDDPSSSSSSSSSDSDSSSYSDHDGGYDSSSSDSSSSDSSGDRKKRERRRKKQSRRRARKRRAARKKKKKSKNSSRKFSGPDPSIGDKQRIFDMDIMGGEIDKVLAPEGMKKSGAAGLADVMRDITSEPGMSGLSNGGDDIEDTRDEGSSMIMAEALLATASEGRKKPKDDVLWRRAGRHAMRTVKGEESLFEMASELDSIGDDIFENQELHIHHYLTKCHFDSDSIREYLDRGLFPRLIRDTYHNYLALVNKARCLQWDHAEEWGAGPASAMFNYHSKKLLAIRMYSRSKKIHLLRTYTYLRDAKAKSFMDIAMNKNVWVQLANQQSQLALLMSKALSSDQPDGGDKTKLKTTPGNSQACPHCKNVQLHIRLALANKKDVCPLKDQTPGTAKKMARKVIRTHNADKTKEMTAVLEEVTSNWTAQS